jgi:TPR repeat protein
VASDEYRVLRERAKAGDVTALTSLGRRLLTGDGLPAAPTEAIRCFTQAAERGGGEATAQLALFAGWGVLRPRHVGEALDLLQRAAELGFGPAQHELRFLARGAGTDWQALRRQVDINAWTSARPVRIVSSSPRIGVIDGFASADECEWLIERGRRDLRRARVYRRDAAGHAEVDNRTNTESDFTIVNADLVLSLMRDRIAACIGTGVRYFEMTKLLNYQPGQFFGLHADFQAPDTLALAREIEEHGQRVMTFLTYLNDDYEGGETDFPRIGYRYKGRRGDALYFVNVDGAGAPDYRTVHAGLPPASGTKWLLSQWVRSRPVT